MNEFVTLCGRDRVPIIWFQDTSGIDVGDIAEKAELLGLGQSLIYSIQSTDVPQLLVVLRKGTAAAHYVMGGPTANRHNALTLGVATTEIYVMHGETAAAASFSRRLVKEKGAGKPLQPVIDKMNQMAQEYHDNSRPAIVPARGSWMKWSKCRTSGATSPPLPASAPTRTPTRVAIISICPQHQMLTVMCFLARRSPVMQPLRWFCAGGRA
jgi:glutaconyl-CoA decarboxylase